MKFGHENISTAILPLSQEEQLSVNAKEFTLSPGELLPGGLPRNGFIRISDHPDKTSEVYLGC